MSRQKTVGGRIILFASVSCLRLPSWLQVILFHEDFRKRSPAFWVVIWIFFFDGRLSEFETEGLGHPRIPVAQSHWDTDTHKVYWSVQVIHEKSIRMQGLIDRHGPRIGLCVVVATYTTVQVCIPFLQTKRRRIRKENGFQKDRTFFVSLASLFCSFSLGLKLYLACKKGKNLTYFLLC